MTSNRFAMAVHIMTLLDVNEGERMTSELIAGSVNTNPVVIRRIIGMLSKAGLVTTNAGVAGAVITRPTDQITLLDIYNAVSSPTQDELFAIHEKPNPNCGVGRNIQSSLEKAFDEAKKAMENKLSEITLAQIAGDVAGKINIE
ncbi:Rrf2 family transcriptional regulator [Paenibacillus harenae]|uniref:DNA-binding IscR family transcriptional regulator n=1 Tax=Paenibacillus harenae TaxID=306543 RepID=A0ABT9TZI1_PAEHA|nr:Rrf2 family transcriptional regulator [Paenibacillus harenae]MDQ0112774.1 DNA-binding IscR family transcriptional regulator [Paenibacillus harenae]